MPAEPTNKRTYAFVDGQNLFHAAREAFGYTYPNYDPQELARVVCHSQGWSLSKVFFYTGIPDREDNRKWHEFWARKLAAMGRQGIQVFSRSLRYRNQRVTLPDGSSYTFLSGSEKGVDVRLALDLTGAARRNDLDVALVFSQDQDLSEAADEIRAIAREQDRWIKIACAFPSSPTSRNRRGIDKTDWIRIDKATYDRCIDPRDYFPAREPGD